MKKELNYVLDESIFIFLNKIINSFVNFWNIVNKTKNDAKEKAKKKGQKYSTFLNEKNNELLFVKYFLKQNDNEKNLNNIFKVDEEINRLQNKIKSLEKDKSYLYKEIERLKAFEDKNKDLKNKIKENENIICDLKNKIKENENIIYDSKKEINYLTDKNKLLENNKNEEIISNKSKDEIIKLLKKLEIKNKEINDLKSKIGFDLKEGENLMSIIFVSVDQVIHYSIICKNTDNFSKIEKILYDKYPEYKKSENYFLYKGKKINRFETIEENGIEYSALITLNKYE